MHIKFLALSFLLFVLVACSKPADSAGLKKGAAVPEVEATDCDGKALKLSSFKGKKGVVLFFIPKADTPG